ncbi:hypothetical protein [Arenimonas sp. MALMAid1274]|uniref:hypothetical protein n=1 Tax=Arenimonas sp. MALMAid1274 TaxID=3411630 RepID=UPI003BA2C7F3
MTSRDPNPSPGHDRVHVRARALFDRASDGVDQGMAYRLRRARQEALQPRSAPRPGRGLVPVGAFAAAVLAVGVSWWSLQPSVAPPVDPEAAQLSSEIDALLVEEDADLYAWLADAPVAVANRGPGL